jgi:RimJ/RimL family protein N-acetyltransferase
MNQKKSNQIMESLQNIKSVTVRVLTPADADAYRSVRLRALHEYPPAFGSLPEDEPNLSETVKRLAQSDDRCFLGAFQGEQLIGIIRLSRYSAPNEKHRAYLGGLYVLPSFRGQGCGKALVREVLVRAASTPGIRRVNLTVVTQQEIAVRLYQSFGFQIYGTEQETFSRDGLFYDEHLMTLEFSSSYTHAAPERSDRVGMFSFRAGNGHELRLLRTSDADELFTLTDANRAYLRTWLPWLDKTTSSANTRDFIQSTLQQFAENRGFVAAIYYDRSMVGVIGYNQINWCDRIGYIGYWIAEAYQGKGLMTISCKAIVDYGFEVLNLNRLVIACATENKRSRAIPERLGFVREATTRDAEWLYDRFVDHEVYVQLRRDWNYQNV